MLSQSYFGAKYFAQGFLAGQPADVTPQGGTFLLALHGTGGASVSGQSPISYLWAGMPVRKIRENDEALLMMLGAM